MTKVSIHINLLHALQHLGRLGLEVGALVGDVQEIQTDPAIKAELANCPLTSAVLADIAVELRSFQNDVS